MTDLDNMDMDALKAKALGLGVPVKGNKKQLAGAIRKHLEANPAPAASADKPNPGSPEGGDHSHDHDHGHAPAQEHAHHAHEHAHAHAHEPAPAPVKRYRVTPRNGVDVNIADVHVVPAGGVTVDEGHPLTKHFDNYVDVKEITE